MIRNVGNLDVVRDGQCVSIRVRHVILHPGGQPGRYGEALLADVEVRKLIGILEDALRDTPEDDSDLA